MSRPVGSLRHASAGGDSESAQLARKLGHQFAHPALLQQALTHRSFSADHNERLEFLGDSVLNLAVSGLLFERLPHAPEGDLSRIRANLVKQDSLHRIALKLDLSSALRLGEGELRSGGLNRPSILADALEAVLGAVYLDAGYTVAEAVVRRLFADVDMGEQAMASGKDAKTALQEWLQARKLPLPRYELDEVSGEAHAPQFQVVCTLERPAVRTLGTGSSRRIAPLLAGNARHRLHFFGDDAELCDYELITCNTQDRLAGLPGLGGDEGVGARLRLTLKSPAGPHPPASAPAPCAARARHAAGAARRPESAVARRAGGSPAAFAPVPRPPRAARPGARAGK